MDEKLLIRIFADGRIQAETKGIKGEKCTDMIPLLEELLQAEAIEAEYTSEFYETEQREEQLEHEQTPTVNVRGEKR
ncbi:MULTISPECIES: DUF2997 domain-containing protein [Saccharibacillus]|uniref:DUF2997 domain-containing protein n=1 Tax=Saccharibacillus TaxID=456492 RepID=UPI001553CC20|nr:MULTISPECIES: DUF2997 domain-containing protein [Saccharibacillus]